MSKNFWKEAYQDLWVISSKKEMLIKNIIETETNLKVSESGLGAGSTEFIDGSALDNNLEKGGADLYIEEINMYIEVTGPNIPMSKYALLWIRPDKLNNTYSKLKKDKTSKHVLVHVQDIEGKDEKLIRGIILNNEFFDRAKKDGFRTVTPTIRGNKEKYIELYVNDKCLISFDSLIDYIKNLKKEKNDL